jgi:hypothetical protein
MTVSFIYCYARSGGTLLNRCLNNLSDLVVLSEVHPIYDTAAGISPAMSIAWQAREWYGIELASRDYLSQVCELHEWCTARGKHLVIRDWTFIDFTPNGFNALNPAKTSTSYALLRDVLEVKAIGFIRDAIDVGLSIQANFADFSSAYLDYACYLVEHEVELFRYEDFCHNSVATLARICTALGLPPLDGQTISPDSRRVNGDIGFSRGNRKNAVAPLKRKYVPSAIRAEIDADAALKECNRLLGYPTGYDSRHVESLQEHLVFTWLKPLGELKRRVGRKLLAVAAAQSYPHVKGNQQSLD